MPIARPSHGFTLIELMVTVTVVIVLAMVAVPSFQAVRQRAAIRGAAEDALSFWNQARLEAAKRNQRVKVGLFVNGTSFCLGAARASSALDTAACNCLEAVPALLTTTCDVARFPQSQTDWYGVTATDSTIGGATWPTATPAAAVIDPKLSSLAASSQAGRFTFTSPPGPRSYRLRMHIDQFGRARLCQPSGDAAKLSDYGTKVC